ncbi:glycosyltransferase [Erwinia sp. P7711]|uniref:glycosyltransferase family 2 protein n=1 Tax=Erwinia sp. P7711 TaxID=3141451 RepID=UPI003196449D
MKEIISIVVVTFNSEKTIIETLNSIRQQDYGSANLKLIISDDFSTDFTIKIIKDWLSDYASEFNEVVLLTSVENSGVSANCNRAWKKVDTLWVKSIGGDDLLRPNCISSYVQYKNTHKESFAIFSRMQWFGYISKVVPEKYDMPFFEMTACEQHEYLKFKSFNLAPTSFLNTNILAEVGYADERFRNIEDLPLWLRITGQGYKLSFNDEITVNYRVANSISKNSQRYINEGFLNDLINIDKMHTFKELKGLYPKLLKIDTLILLNGKRLIKKVTNNKKGRFSKILDIIHFMMRPVYFFVKIKKMFINKFL